MRDSRGFMWFCTRDGLSRFDGARFVTYRVGDKNAPPRIEGIYQTRDGNYWITTTGGTYRFKAAAVLEVASNSVFRQKEQNGAFVLMQYFGYLRRDPDTAPDNDLSGYNFWLNKLNQFNGDYLAAEMVRSFLVSLEYRQRFGQ